MKTFTPTQVKADLIFVFGVVAALGFNLSNTLTVALLGSCSLLAVGLNFAEAHVHVGKGLQSTIDKALGDFKGLLPDIQAAVSALPGKVAAEVAKAIELAEKGPQNAGHAPKDAVK
jgi:hypothetical protein